MLHKFFSKFLYKDTESLIAKSPKYQEYREHFQRVLIGKDVLRPISEFLGVFDATINNREQIQKELDEIRQRLSTLEKEKPGQ